MLVDREPDDLDVDEPPALEGHRARTSSHTADVHDPAFDKTTPPEAVEGLRGLMVVAKEKKKRYQSSVRSCGEPSPAYLTGIRIGRATESLDGVSR